VLENRNLVISSKSVKVLMFPSPRLFLGYTIGSIATLQASTGFYSGLG